MKILTGGCSFTAHNMPENLAWPYHLESLGYKIFNSAEMASGNQIIADRICWEIEKQHFDQCIVMWSNPYRFELFLNRENPDYEKIHQHMVNHASYTNYFINGPDASSHSNSNWIRTGGGYGIWNFGNSALDSLVKNYLTHHFNYEYQFIQTCKSIVMVQLMCKQFGIKLINTCWQNIWDNLYNLSDDIIGTNWLNDNTIEKLKLGRVRYIPIIDRYPNAKHWYNLIDWSSWIFYESEHIKRGGLGEFAVLENGDKLDRSHPSRSSQKLWAEFLLEKIK